MQIVLCTARFILFKMEPFDTENFISEIQNRAILWNSHLPEYSNKVLKKNAWEEICLIFCENFEEKTSKEKNLSGELF